MRKYMKSIEGTPRPKAMGIPLKRAANNTPITIRPRMFGSMGFVSFGDEISQREIEVSFGFPSPNI
jgi:hypothetical protein